MNRYARAVLMQPCHNSRADSSSGTGYEHDFAIKVMF
jgi:hypothetical protein